MGSILGGASTPSYTPPPLPPPLPEPPTSVNPAVKQARINIRQRAGLLSGSQYIGTSPQGLLTPAFTAKKSLLGQ